MPAKRKMRIAFAMIYYPVAMGRYFLEALRRRKDVELWTFGPYTAQWIPWDGGMNLPTRYVFRPDLPLSMPPFISYGWAENSKPWEPDLWLEVNAAMQTEGRPKGKYAVVGTDPHVLDYTPQRRLADYFFGMQTPYLHTGDIWLPYAYDPIWHSFSPVPAALRTNDAALIGLHYEKRNQLVDQLRAQGMTVQYTIGPAYEDARAIYHDTRVGLDWASLQDLNARAFELMALGCAPLLSRVPDLGTLFVEGRDYEGFDTLDEAVAKAVALARDPARVDELARNARRAVEPHTWDARVRDILHKTGLLPEAEW